MRSRLLKLDPAAADNLPLGGASGFALSPAASDANAPFPVEVFIRRGNDESRLLVRSGRFYAFAEPLTEARVLAPAPGGTYQLDTAEAGESIT
jgi:hypothetical protein